MSSPAAPESRAEVLRIANLIGVGEADIEFLDQLSAEALYEFRQQLIGVYFEENPRLRSFAKVANILPSALIAKITVDAIGPTIAARVVGEVDPKTAISVLKRVPVDFIVDTAIQADPRRIIPLFELSPTEISKAVADELLRRKEYVAIGLMIGFVEDEVMDYALQNASDMDILLSSFMVEDKERLSDGVEMLGDERLASLIKVASEEDMWLEALDLLSHLNTDEFRRVASNAMALSPKKIGEFLEFVHEHELWYVGIPTLCLAEKPANGVKAVLAAPDKIKQAITAELAASDYSDEVEELLTRTDEPGIIALLDA